MVIIAKCSAAAIFVSLISLLIKKHNPELSLAVSIVLTTLILSSCIGMYSTLKDLIKFALEALGTSSTLVRPMFKCLCIALVSKFASDVCKDASQNSAASALELGAALCAASVAMPLIISTLKMIGTLV